MSKRNYKNVKNVISAKLGFVLAFMLSQKALAADGQLVQIPSWIPAGPSVKDLATNVINVLIWVVGIASIIVIIIAGLMYVLSAGNPERTKTAKDAILYAIIGLLISLSAFAIINFVIKPFSQ